MPIVAIPTPEPAGSSYGSTADLAAYLYVEESTLDADCARLLERASELIDHYTLHRYNTSAVSVDLATQTEAMKKATCAQVEFWLAKGEAEDISGPIEGYTVGKVQVQFGAGSNRLAPLRLAPRARQALLAAGLLYAGASAGRGGIF